MSASSCSAWATSCRWSSAVSAGHARGRRRRGHEPQQDDAFNVPQQSGEPLVIGVTMSPRKVGGESERRSESSRAKPVGHADGGLFCPSAPHARGRDEAVDILSTPFPCPLPTPVGVTLETAGCHARHRRPGRRMSWSRSAVGALRLPSPLPLRCRCESIPQGFVGDLGVNTSDHRHGRRSVAESPGHGLKRDACRCHPGTAGSA